MSDEPLPPIKLFISLILLLFCTSWEYRPPDWAVEQVEEWRPLIREVIQEKERHPKLTEELILSIIAQESMGNRYAISSDGWHSIGLMQIIPRSWIGTKEELLNPKFNVQWGIWFVEVALYSNDGNVMKALQQYNCGPDAREDCGKWYADRILNYWIWNFRSQHPIFQGKRLER